MFVIDISLYFSGEMLRCEDNPSTVNIYLWHEGSPIRFRLRGHSVSSSISILLIRITYITNVFVQPLPCDLISSNRSSCLLLEGIRCGVTHNPRYLTIFFMLFNSSFHYFSGLIKIER